MRLQKWPWNSDGGDSTIYGLEPNFGCVSSSTSPPSHLPL